MKRVFLSRPTWIEPKYQDGLDGFLKILEVHDIDPRTVGTTDYSTKAPMEDVIELMRTCVGAIIIGYPQIMIEKGFLKGKEINEPVHLATEWNHIEAGLAVATGLPLLVIHDTKVQRGIFDKGTLNSFLYCVELENDSWSLSDNIQGVLKKWITQLHLPRNQSSTSIGTEEKPRFKWGCYVFEGDEILYCPACFENRNKKIPTSRLNSKFRQCPSCKARLG